MTGLIFLSFFDIEKLWNIKEKKLTVSFSKKVTLKKIPTSIILFDGVCNLCNSWVQFILKREKNKHYHFASLQSETAKVLLKEYSISLDLSSIILVEDGIIYQKSDAILRICENLRYPWYLIRWCLIIPKVFRDRIYDFVASNRYMWFGKKQQCDLLDTDQRARFLDNTAT
ncbi:DUF393 domain-containing protein [Aquimarina litoralis]|nr:DUF393 domain-containing protein [Aquimarina litoralis]